ncbi:Beta-barrel assembly machine subunit BamD [Plasticicumulans lactativorans]|uniref:Outer membrane protein assembly factor BamD n=1 Tax=Plasticicumulans lactativorans TaxID=1133106 RepID=A0A4R2LBM4_9GAMM|nr:outer membrane protein assembly factor BamD [Plasticicumulans lactativorans]TCO80208.1 Beta-barrel assembly machine subunit BamD [Plasticicumulans lactativorans]
MSASRRPFLATLALLLAFAGVSGCSLLPDKIDETRNWSAAKFYSEAKDALDNGNYQQAITYYEKLQARYPFGKYAQQAQLESIYAYYKDSEPDSAIAAADRFIKTNPRHPYVDYAYYLKGLVNFNRADGPVDRLLPADPTRTDSATAMQSFNDFNELVTKFPDSKYAPDARQRMLFLRNNLASYEVNVAAFYLERGAYVAAVNRGKYVLENYSSAPAAADALAVMTRAYAAMGMRDLARDYLRVLRENAPNRADLPQLSALVEG